MARKAVPLRAPKKSPRRAAQQGAAESGSRGLAPPRELEKTPTGIRGLDDVTGGGFPRGRPTLVCGGPGCGKTLLAMEFLVRGVLEHGEAGVFVSFEEGEDELAQNVASLGFDLPALVADGKLALERVRVERSEIEESGGYNLDGLFIRLAHAFDAIGAKRVVLDTIEALFSGLDNTAILRAELRRLFRWLKERGVTAVITGERGDGQLTRQGLEEYVSDCVLLLDHRVVDQISTRRLRIVKYRGSTHGTNEFPFLIDRTGISVVPITGAALVHDASSERISTGIARLDTMLGGRGFFRGSSVLVSGTAGSGKTSVALTFANAACARGDKVLYFAFEESPSQILRNALSIGLDLKPWVDRGLLVFKANRPTLYGLEMHLAAMHRDVLEHAPKVVLVDPITNVSQAGSREEASRMLLRLVDLLKARQVTALFTDLTHGASVEKTENMVSSIMDAWILLRNVEISGERNRVLYVLKARGMAHSNQLREFRLTDAGVELVDVYLGSEGVLTGSARVQQQAREQQEEHERRAQLAVREQAIERKRVALEAQIAALRADLAAEEAELARTRTGAEWQRQHVVATRKQLAEARWSDPKRDRNGTKKTESSVEKS